MGKVKIQAIHSCLYLCMDTCGMPYASKEYWDECIFNEVMESNLYNTYSSGKYSNARRTLYLGLNRLGEPRRVQIRGGSLGKLAAYTRVLTQAVTPRQAAGARCRGSGPPGSRETGKCLRRHGGQGPRGPVGPHGRPRQRRKRKRCREGEPCPPRRRRPLPPPHPRRHRKHRAPPTLAPEDDPEDDSFEEDDLPELFMDDNE